MKGCVAVKLVNDYHQWQNAGELKWSAENSAPVWLSLHGSLPGPLTSFIICVTEKPIYDKRNNFFFFSQDSAPVSREPAEEIRLAPCLSPLTFWKRSHQTIWSLHTDSDKSCLGWQWIQECNTNYRILSIANWGVFMRGRKWKHRCFLTCFVAVPPPPQPVNMTALAALGHNSDIICRW